MNREKKIYIYIYQKIKHYTSNYASDGTDLYIEREKLLNEVFNNQQDHKSIKRSIQVTNRNPETYSVSISRAIH